MDEGFPLVGVNRLCIRRYFDSSMFVLFEATLMMTDGVCMGIE